MTSNVVPAGGLHGQVLTGLRWKIVSQFVAQGSRVALAIILARLLTPREFGLAAMALVFAAFANIFTDLSLGAALVQQTTITEEDRSTVFWTTVGAGAGITALGVWLAPTVGHFFSTPDVAPLFAASASLAFLFSLAVTQTAILTRELDFRSLEIRAIVSTVVGMAAAVGIAFAGFGAWAIVGQNISTAVVSAVLLWRLSPWRPRRVYSVDSLRTLGSFGVKTLFSRILTYLNLSGDNLLIGRFLGSKPLGVYSVAYNVMYAPLGQVAQPVQQVLFAAFVKVKDERSKLGRAWLRGNKLVCSLTVPGFLAMIVLAPDFVPVVFGHRWRAAVPVLQLLCLAGVAESFKMLNWAVLQAMGMAGRLLRFMIFSTAVTLAAFIGGLTWGVVGVAGLYAIARAITLVVYTWTTCRPLGLPLVRFAKLVAGVLLFSVPMTVGMYVMRVALVHEHVAPALRLVALVVVGAVLYFGTVAWRGRELVHEFRGLFAGRAA